MQTDKVAIVGDRVIVAGTGAVGHGQRFQAHVKASGDAKLFQKPCVDVARELSRLGAGDFQHTGLRDHRDGHGYGYGALMAAPFEDRAELIEFGIADFQPEIKNTRLHFVSMGSGQMLAEPFMGFISRVIWGGQPPTVQAATLGVYWALQHAIKMAPGGVGPPICVSTLRKVDRTWTAQLLDDGQLEEQAQHIAAIEETIRKYPGEIIADAEATPPPKPPGQ